MAAVDASSAAHLAQLHPVRAAFQGPSQLRSCLGMFILSQPVRARNGPLVAAARKQALGPMPTSYDTRAYTDPAGPGCGSQATRLRAALRLGDPIRGAPRPWLRRRARS